MYKDDNQALPLGTFHQLITAIFFIAVAASACLMPLQNDTWWHLRTGAEMWSRGRVMLTDEFSFTAAGRFWPDHEWLSEVLMYGAFVAGGLRGLTLLAAGCVTASVALSWRLMRGTSGTRLLLMALGISSLVLVWTARPLVFTLVLLMTVIHLGLRRWYWPLPLVFALWANLHGGVALGLVALGGLVLSDAYLFGVSRALRVVPWVALCFAATLVTPLGVDLWRTIPESIHKSVANGIAEWRPPQLGLRDLGFWLIGASFLAVLARRWRALVTPEAHSLSVIALLLLPLALRYSRNITPFVMVALPALSHMVQLPGSLTRRHRSHERPALNMLLACSFLIVAVTVVLRAWAAPSAWLQWRPVSLPVLDGVRTCNGRLYNRFDDGGYLIWFVPEMPVFVDSRQDPYPLEFLQEHLHHEQTGDFKPVFAKYRLTCAFLPRSSPTAVGLQANGWRITASDQQWLVLQAAATSTGAEGHGALPAVVREGTQDRPE
jgi:hypothetical protein